MNYQKAYKDGYTAAMKKAGFFGFGDDNDKGLKDAGEVGEKVDKKKTPVSGTLGNLINKKMVEMGKGKQMGDPTSKYKPGMTAAEFRKAHYGK